MVGLLLLLVSSSRTIPVEASAPVPDTEEKKTLGSSKEQTKKQLPRNYRFAHKTIIIPHDQKKFRGGEDAASTTSEMLVVADGVGGWANKGVNPGLYSRKLTKTITSEYLKLSPAEQDTINLKSLVHKSNHAAADQHLGSATCTVVRLKDASTLETVNIGDSGYSIHRRRVEKDDGETENGSSDNTELNPSDLEVVYASVPGQKGFNFPYQLGGQYGDQVYDENVTDGPNTHDLQDNDVIVVVSDGVIDNIDPHEYHACIGKYQWSKSLTGPTIDLINAHLKGYFHENELVSYSAVADCIARKAYFLGKDKTYDSPFARSAARYGKRYLGGKHDDITVTVAQVERAAYDKAKGVEAFLVNLEEDDPHKTESIFVYKDSDGPIEDSSKMLTMDGILRKILDKADVGLSSGEL
jgi:protein phosphatase PTC7